MEDHCDANMSRKLVSFSNELHKQQNKVIKKKFYKKKNYLKKNNYIGLIC